MTLELVRESYFGHKITDTITEAVEHVCRSQDQDGSLTDTIAMIGRMLTVMHENGLLGGDDVVRILYDGKTRYTTSS